MTKKLFALICVILLRGVCNIPWATYTWNEGVAIKNMPLPQHHAYQQVDAISSNVEDTMQWIRSYGGAQDDTAWSVIQTTDGGYAFAGTTGSWPFDQAWLVKIDTYGNVQWSQTYNSSFAYVVLQTIDGGYALAGTRARIHLRGLSDAWIVKTDSHGMIQWNQTIDWNDEDEARTLIQTSDGGFVLGGSSAALEGQWDSWLVKIDANGNMEWHRSYRGPLHENIFAVIQTVAGGFAFTGSTSSYGAGEFDVWLATTDTNGVMQWNQTFGGPGYDRAYMVIQTVDDSFILIGTTTSYGAGGFDAWVIKTDVDGKMKWNYTFGKSSHDDAYSGILTVDDGLVLVGGTNSYGVDMNDMDFWLVKLNARGEMQWNQTYGGTRPDRANSVVQTADGGFILAGRSRSFRPGQYMWDALLVKTDALGVVADIQQYNWFEIGLLGSLILATITVVVLWVKISRSRVKWR